MILKNPLILVFLFSAFLTNNIFAQVENVNISKSFKQNKTSIKENKFADKIIRSEYKAKELILNSNEINFEKRKKIIQRTKNLYLMLLKDKNLTNKEKEYIAYKTINQDLDIIKKSKKTKMQKEMDSIEIDSRSEIFPMLLKYNFFNNK